jgi:hypothetical protein
MACYRAFTRPSLLLERRFVQLGYRVIQVIQYVPNEQCTVAYVGLCRLQRFQGDAVRSSYLKVEKVSTLIR